MNIAIVGFGRMGRKIYEKAVLSSHEVVSVTDSFSSDPMVTAREITAEGIGVADCVIDFSSPDAAVGNIMKYVDIGVPAVIGTTGWTGRLDEVRKYVMGKNGAILWSGNFSIGVAATLKIVSFASALMNALPSYDAAVFETHHRMKADSPSGTALMLAGEVVRNLDRKSTVDAECQHSKIGDDVLHLSSLRVGSVPGTHEVIFDSDVDTITIRHEARSRDGFATGAVRAAEWLTEEDRKGLFSMDDFINSLLGV
ncbi:MAG: 4-hydroxy-tetrahydrodipicolinate reductase [Bullifex sp.]